LRHMPRFPDAYGASIVLDTTPSKPRQCDNRCGEQSIDRVLTVRKSSAWLGLA
jgi:hypothetical protein